MNQLLADNERLILAAQVEAVRVCTAYDLAGKPPVATVAPVEMPSHVWQIAAADYEQRHGVRLVKYFSSTWARTGRTGR